MRRRDIHDRHRSVRATRRVGDAFEFRSIFMIIVFAALFGVLIVRAFWLQVVEYDRWEKLAAKIQVKAEPLTHRRGPILDRNGDPLAISVDADSIAAYPRQVEDKDAAAVALARVLDMRPRDVRERLDMGRFFTFIKRQVEPEVAASVAELKLAGIGIIKESRRRYPRNSLAANVLGFAGRDMEGREGLELGYDEVLRGEAGRIVGVRDARGHTLYPDGVNIVDSSIGGTLSLTIDATAQYLVETALEEGWKRSNAKYALALVMEPDTGRIVAMAQRPSFDPNRAGQASPEARKNHLVTDMFEPGSVMKPFSIAAAIEDGLVRPDESVHCEGGAMRIGKHIIHDVHAYQQLTVSQIIQKSSNICTAKIAMRLTRERFHEWILHFGFGARTGLPVSGEAYGQVHAASTWSRIAHANIAFGQGVSMTPVQLLTGFCALVNGGSLMRPYIVAEARDEHGVVIEKNHPTIVRRVIRRETSRAISEMLGLVTQPGGTGTAAAVPGFTVGGKTGTAQKSDPVRGGYGSERVGSFIGAIPAVNPRLAILVIMDEPSGGMSMRYGGVCAAPVFRVIGQTLMQHLYGGPAPKPGETDIERLIMIARAEQERENSAVTEAIVEDESKAPNVVGLPLREVIQIATTREINLTVVGTGVSLKQDPGPGTPLTAGRQMKVEFGPAG
ncbi:transpeptidase family protein [bacterium]|nr:transpeptidase family protein [bacterium]